MTERLVTLPDGSTWAAHMIEGISADRNKTPWYDRQGKGPYNAKVTVRIRGEGARRLPCETLEEAERLVAEIGNEVRPKRCA